MQRAVADAYAWQRALGNQIIEGTHCRFLVSADDPDVWMANHALGVTAQSEDEIDAVLAEMEVHYAHCEHRFVSISPFTPHPFVARLALEDYRELSPTIQMVLSGDLPAIMAAPLIFRTVLSDADWEDIYGLMRIDHEEGKRFHGVEVSAEITRGLIADMRRKAGPTRQYIVECEGTPCAYGTAILCPNGLGMIEDLFTLPTYRKRGIASALIQLCVKTLRQEMPRAIFLGAHMTEQPKHLYKRLGFAPIMLTREYIREV